MAKRGSLRNSTTTLIIIILGVTILLGGFVTTPVIFRIRGLSSNINETQTALEQEYEKSQQLRRSNRELSDVLRRTAVFSDAFVAENQELQLITQLENLAEIHNIDQELSVGFSEGAGLEERRAAAIAGRTSVNLPHYTFTFTSRGTFNDILAFFYDLEGLPFYVVIRDVQFSSARAEDGVVGITARFVGRIYIRE